ncbi:flavin monoamine oxidase family protein [Nannocystaceae bacterium ST9]
MFLVDDEPLDAIVIGAGLSGLAAAHRLYAAGKRVRVIEARERVGGRTWTVDFVGGPADLGGQWIGPGQDRVLALCRELDLGWYEQYQVGEKLLEYDGEIRRYRGYLPKLPIFALVELGVVLGRIDRAAKRVPREAPWQARKAAKLDAIDVATWLKQQVLSHGARTILRIAIEGVFATHPRELSLLYFLHYVHCSGGIERLTRITGGAQNWKIEGGAQRLSERLAERLGNALRLGEPVSAIEQDESGVTVRTPAGTHRAQRLILATAPGLAESIEFAPALPSRRIALQREMPMGKVIKVLLAYDLPFWRSLGLSGEAISEGLSVRMVFDACGPRHSAPARLVAFVLGDQAARLSKVSATVRREVVIADLVRLFGPDAARPIGYVDCNWADERWSAGCYVGLLAPERAVELGPALREVVGRVHFAGTEAATRWAGYMEGAIESGERAAGEVALALA